MQNTEFLKKAEDSKPILYTETVCIPGRTEPMKDGDEAVFDFGNHYVGYPEITFETVGHHPDAPLYFEVQFAEIAEELDQDTDSYNGWISRSWIQKEAVHMDVLPGTYRFERRYAFRYVRIRILSVSGNYSVVVKELKADTVTSADDAALVKVPFTGKDKRLDEVSVRTLRSCMQDVFEDGPKRDRRLWLGDLRLEALADYETYRNYGLVKRCLYLFAGSTLKEGRLANNMFMAPEVECDDQTMFDYTLFFINTLWDYWSHSHDTATLKDLEPVCMRQYELLKECFDEDDLLDMNKAGNVFIDWNFQLDKQASGQAVYIYALKDLVKIRSELGKDIDELICEIERKTEAAKSLYDAEKGVFISGPEKQISLASQVWMVLAGVTDQETGQAVMENALQQNAVGMNSPYAYHHYIQALIETGQKDKAYREMHAYWGGMIERGTDTFWELYNPADPSSSPYGGIVVHSFCHAWSCTPAYFLRKYFRPQENQ